MHMALGHDRDGHGAGRGRSVGVVMRVVMRMVVTGIVGMPMVMPTAMPCRIGAAFGFERQVLCFHDEVHGAQHVGQHMVGLDLEVVGLQFDGHMAVAQVEPQVVMTGISV